MLRRERAETRPEPAKKKKSRKVMELGFSSISQTGKVRRATMMAMDGRRFS